MKKLTKKHEELISFIEHMLSISISDKIDVRFTKRKSMTIDIDELKENDIRMIEYLGYKYNRYRVEPNGVKKIALIIL